MQLIVWCRKYCNHPSRFQSRSGTKQILISLSRRCKQQTPNYALPRIRQHCLRLSTYFIKLNFEIRSLICKKKFGELSVSQTSLKTLRNMSLVNSCSIVHNSVSFQEIYIDLTELDKKAARMLETCINFHTFIKQLRDPSACFFPACFFPYHRFVFDGLVQFNLTVISFL